MKVESLARVTSQSLVKNTGRSWDEWLGILKKAGADAWPRKEVVSLLKSKYKLSPWYQQIVASGHQQHLGKRVEGQNVKGLYAAAGSRMVPANAARVWKFLMSTKGAAVWLKPLDPVKVKPGVQFELEGGMYGEIRTLTRDERKSTIRVRLQEDEWAKPSVLTLIVVVRDEDRCTVGFAHDDLPDARTKERLWTHWKSVIDELIQIFGN